MVTDDRQYSRQRSAGSGAAAAVRSSSNHRIERAEQAAFAQVVAHPRFDGAEILADDDRAGAVRLQRDDADHRLVVVAHVGALGRQRRPSGIHHSRNSPMMWSMRTPPACRSTALISARNGS